MLIIFVICDYDSARQNKTITVNQVSIDDPPPPKKKKKKKKKNTATHLHKLFEYCNILIFGCYLILAILAVKAKSAKI